MPTSESVPVTTTLQTEKINPAICTAAEIRKDFPILARQVHGKPLVYLDSTSSSQKPYAVIEAMSTYYEMYHANVHRGVYEISEEATARMEKALVKVARFINAPRSKQIIFHRTTPETINLIYSRWVKQNTTRREPIPLSPSSHDIQRCCFTPFR